MTKQNAVCSRTVAVLTPIWQEERGGAGDAVAHETPREGGQVETEATPAQAALMEVWVGLQGYGIATERATKEEAAAALLPKLRRALSLDAPVAGAPMPMPAEGVGGGEEGTAPLAPVSRLEVRARAQEQVGEVLGEGFAVRYFGLHSVGLSWCVGCAAC